MQNFIYIFIYFLLFSLTTLAVIRESWMTFLLAVFTIGAIFGLRSFFRRTFVVYPKEIEIALVLFIVMSFIVDDIFFIQSNSLLPNVIMHTISGALFSTIAFVLVYALNHFHKTSLRLTPFFVTLFAFTFSISFSFLWIVFENIVKAIFSGFNNSVGTVLEQSIIVMSVMFGALAVSFLGYRYLVNGSNNIIGKTLEKFFSTNPSVNGGLKASRDDSLEIIKKGETDSVEFKSTLRKNVHTNEKDKRIEHASLKTICAFLNSSGGVLFVGVNDDGDVLGIEGDEFANNDKFQLHFTNLFNQHIGEQFASFINVELLEIDSKYILRVDCFRSDVPIFLKTSEKEEFFIRISAATQELQGSKLMGYIQKNF